MSRGHAPEHVVRLPRFFYDDHAGRGLDTPEAVRQTKRHVWVRLSDPALPELVSDAEYHAYPDGFDPEIARIFCPAARATLAAITKARAESHGVPSTEAER